MKFIRQINDFVRASFHWYHALYTFSPFFCVYDDAFWIVANILFVLYSVYLCNMHKWIFSLQWKALRHLTIYQQRCNKLNTKSHCVFVYNCVRVIFSCCVSGQNVFKRDEVLLLSPSTTTPIQNWRAAALASIHTHTYL